MTKPIWIVVSVGFIMVLYFSWRFVDTGDPKSTRSKSREKPIDLEEPVFSNYDDGRLKWQMAAVKAKIFEAETRSLLYSVTGTLYSHKHPERVEIVIFADNYMLTETAKISEFYNNVRVHFSDGKRLYTDRLFFDQKKETIYSSQATKIDDLNGQIKASSFFYDIRSKLLKFEHPKMKIDLD